MNYLEELSYEILVKQPTRVLEEKISKKQLPQPYRCIAEQIISDRIESRKRWDDEVKQEKLVEQYGELKFKQGDVVKFMYKDTQLEGVVFKSYICPKIKKEYTIVNSQNKKITKSANSLSII